jgi:cyclase
MLRKRIIFTLLYENGNFMLSRNFRLQKVGDINWLEKNYKFSETALSLDELIVLDVTRNDRSILNFSRTISRLVENVFIPVAAGGGIKTLYDADILFKNGADKLVINSLLFDSPEIVKDIVKNYGTQSVVASVDYKIVDQNTEVYINNGQTKISLNLFEYLKYIESLNIGEIYLNSMNKDGTGTGYDINTIKSIVTEIKTPLIVAGGAGNGQHLVECLKLNGVNAVATANLFNFVGNGLPKARNEAIRSNLNIVCRDVDN